jgi:hypothetical protein
MCIFQWNQTSLGRNVICNMCRIFNTFAIFLIARMVCSYGLSKYPFRRLSQSFRSSSDSHILILFIYRVIQKEVYTFKMYFTSTIEHMAMCYIQTEGRTLKVIFTPYKQSMWAPRVTRQVKSIIQPFPHSSQHVTGNSSHSVSDAPLQIIDIRTLRDFLSIRTQDMDIPSVVFVK